MDKSEGHVCPLEQKQVRPGDNPGRGPPDGPCCAAARAFWTGDGEGRAGGPAAVDVVRRPGGGSGEMSAPPGASVSPPLMAVMHKAAVRFK